MKHIALRILTFTTYFIILIPYIHGMEVTPKKKKSHKTSHTNVQVANYTGISEGEKDYRQKRLPIVKAALEKMLNRTLQDKQVPTIAMIGSGGGYRAMLCTTGSLCGAHKTGLLDATTYLTALSGSTWAVAPWIATGKTIEEFRKYIKECASKHFLHFTPEEELLVAAAILKKRNVSPFTPVDPYGFCLANHLLSSLGNKRQNITLAQLAKTINQGHHPYPIFTATDARETMVTGENWYEFTVHAVGDRTNHIFIPTETYGKKFKNGTLTRHGHQKSLGYDMGTWGSAFGANVDEIIKEIVKDPALRKEIESKIPKDIQGERPLHFYAEVPNYMHNMDNLTDMSLSKEEYLKFVDSGLEINLPYPPVSGICSERTPEILILLDASAGHMGNQLKKVVAYAQKYNLPFPTIDLTDVDKKTISIFKDEHNPKAPVVIYMPRISDHVLWEEHKLQPEFEHYNLSDFDLDHETQDGFAKTKEFQYSHEHSELVLNQTEFNMVTNKDKIIEAIAWVIDRK
jgi:Lysophospholipase catalytic domain